MLTGNFSTVMADAKKIAKKEKVDWIYVYTDLIVWCLVNKINEDSEFWIALKKQYVDGDVK